jgi:phosphohistidine swiveling domain-containing protein
VTGDARDMKVSGTAFKTLDEITPNDQSEAGGKAFNCARLKQAGFPVPDGIVVPAATTDEEIARLGDHPFFENFDGRASLSRSARRESAELRGLADAPEAAGETEAARLKASRSPDERFDDANWSASLSRSARRESAELRGLADAPEAAGEREARFAVRSSGLDEDSEGHSFAGIHETRLNVTLAGLREAVAVCRRSAGVEQALAYRRAQQLPAGPLRIAVLIQRMVVAATSGVAFTVNPVTGANELVINASWGLGEALVSGTVEPDEFTVSKRDGAVTSLRLGAKGGADSGTAALAPAQIAELADLLLRIEQHYGTPQDVEWCHDGRQFWIVQSRPVTTKTEKGVRPLFHSTQSEKGAVPLFRSGAAAHDIEWTRANLAEVFPDQMSPQALTAYIDLLNEAERRFMGKLLAPYEELGPMVKAFHGRAYFNLSQLRRVCGLTGRAAADAMRSMGHNDEIQPADEIAAWPPLGQLLPILPDFLRVVLKQLRAPRLFARHQQRTSAVIARLSGADPRVLNDADLWAVIEWWRRLAPDYAEIVLVLAAVMVHEVALKKICDQVGFPYERLVLPQLAAGERSVSTQQAIDLVGLAEVARHEPAVVRYLLEDAGERRDYRTALRGTAFLETFDRFLDRYGHRGPYESDWALPRYREEPASLLFAIRSHLGAAAPVDLEALAARQAREAEEAWHAFEAALGQWQRLTLLPRVRMTVRRLKWQYVRREECRSDLTRVIAHLRAWHLALAERFVARGWLDRPNDYFLLRLEEVGAAIEDPGSAPQLRGIVGRRAADLEAQRELRLPLLMRESELPRLLQRADAIAGGDDVQLSGLCVSPGCVEGQVVVMRDPGEFARMTRGAILVAPATDPAWTPLFTLAAGVIVEVGGMLSHASTIAREYGLPALANVKHATEVLKDGERIRLDATGGRIVRIKN